MMFLKYITIYLHVYHVCKCICSELRVCVFESDSMSRSVCNYPSVTACVCVFIPFTVSKASGRQQQLVCLCCCTADMPHTARYYSFPQLCVHAHTHKLSHFFTVSLTAFRHDVIPHFVRRFAHTIALLVCLCVCVCLCVEELQV